MGVVNKITVSRFLPRFSWKTPAILFRKVGSTEIVLFNLIWVWLRIDIDVEAMTGKQTRFDVEDIDDQTSVASASASPHLSHATFTTSALSVYVTPQSSPILSTRRPKDDIRRSNDLLNVDGGEALPTQPRIRPVREFEVSSPAASNSDGDRIHPLATQRSLDYADTVERVPMTLFYRQDSRDNQGVSQRRPTLKELHEPIRADAVSQKW